MPKTHGTRRAGKARGEDEEGDGENHQEYVMGERANAHGGSVGGVGGAPPTTFGDAEFM